MKLSLLIIFAFSLTIHLSAQPYMQGHTRHRFAQMNAGIDARLFPGNVTRSYSINTGGSINSFHLPDHTETRLIFGGTHFWGHADFYVAIPILSNKGKSGLATTAETGAKIYPWKIQHNRIRPYVGFSVLPLSYRQGDGTKLFKYRLPVLAGLTYNKNKHLIDIGVGYYFNNDNTYYISPTMPQQVNLHSLFISLGYKYMFETTLSAEKNWENGKTKWLTDTLSKLKKLNGITIAAGISTAQALGKSSYLESMPYVDDHSSSTLFPDLSIGYYLHNPDIQFNLACRRYKSHIGAYGYTQTATRTSLAFETYRFFADYHGFAPFAGLAISYEHLEISEHITNPVSEINTSAKYIRPGIVIGWDIRPNDLQVFYLRTNLRYFPGLNVPMSSGKTISLDALEINFIQLVVFPWRMF